MTRSITTGRVPQSSQHIWGITKIRHYEWDQYCGYQIRLCFGRWYISYRSIEDKNKSWGRGIVIGGRQTNGAATQHLRNPQTLFNTHKGTKDET